MAGRAAAVIAACAAGALAASLPPGYAARWRADSIVPGTDTSGASINTWRDDVGMWDATPHNTALKPTLMQNAVHCRAAVSYTGGQGLSTVANTALNPGGASGAGGIGVFAVMRVLDVSTYAEAIIKSDVSMFQSWEISHGAAGGFSMNYLWRNGALANSFTTFTDTTNWHAWGMTIDVVDAFLGLKQVRGYRNNDRTGFSDGGLNAATNEYTGAMSMSSKVYVGPMAGSSLRAHVFEYLIYNRAISAAERNAVFAYFDEQYYLTCPVLASPNAVNGDAAAGKAFCAPPTARWGRECYQSCIPGYVQTYGTMSHTCLAGEWTGSAIVCGQECPPLPPLVNMGSCSKELWQVTGGEWIAALDSGAWMVVPKQPRQERAGFWNASAAGMQGRDGFVNCRQSQDSFLVMSSPRWASGITAGKRFTYEALVAITTGRFDLVWNYVNEANFLFVSVACGAPDGQVEVGYVAAGVTQVRYSTVVYLPCGSVPQLQLTMVNQDAALAMDDSILLDGMQLPPLSPGSMGFRTYRLADITIKQARLTTSCDTGGSCLAMTDGQVCQQDCSSGYMLVGSVSRQCVGGAWTGSTSTCVVEPPLIDTSTPQSVVENAPPGTLVGTPIVVSTAARGVAMIYSIVNELPAPSNPVMPRFGIGTCSGQLYVASTNDALDFEALPTYTVRVRVEPNGLAASASEGDITVELRDANEAPFFPVSPLYRNVTENSPVGTDVGLPIIASDPDAAGTANNRYGIVVDGTGGAVGIVPTTGQLYLADAGLFNYEAGATSYVVQVKAFDVTQPALSARVEVFVQVLDGNDAVRMPVDQHYFVVSTDALPGAAIPQGISYADEDVGQGHTFGIVTGNWDPLDTVPVPVLSLHPTTGEMTWTVDKSVWAPDAPTTVVRGRLILTSIRMTVQVADAGGMSATGTVYVHLQSNSSVLVGVPSISEMWIDGAPAPVDVSTTGGAALQLVGQNFDPAHVASVVYGVANANGSLVGVVYNATGCAVVTTTVIECTLPPGVGRDHTMQVSLRSPTGTVARAVPTIPLTVSYAAPNVVSLDGAAALPTQGGVQVCLTGTNLGDGASSALTVSFGPSSSTLWLVAYTTDVTPTRACFIAPPGMGAIGAVQVAVAGQASPVLIATGAGYALPQVTSLAAPAGQTYTPHTLPFGEVALQVAGRNFGPAVGPGAPSAALHVAPAEADGGGGWRHVLGTAPAVLPCDKDATTPHVLMVCRGAVPATSRWLVAWLVVQDQVGPPAHTSANTISEGLLTHGQPLLLSVDGPGATASDTAGGQRISVRGLNVGPLGLVSTAAQGQSLATGTVALAYGARGVGPAGVTASSGLFWASLCTVVAESTAADPVGQVDCIGGEGYGDALNASLSVGGWWSPAAPAAVTFSPPVVTDFSGAVLHAAAGGEAVSIRGRNLYRNISLLAVSYGVQLDPDRVSGLPVAGVQPVAAADGNHLVTFTPSNCTFVRPHYELQCVVLPGGGARVKWSVALDGRASEEPYTRYQPPVIGSIVDASGATASTAEPAGGSVVLLRGVNFGPPAGSGLQMVQWVRYATGSGAYAYVDSAQVTVVNDTCIRLQLGPGLAASVRFEVSVADQVSAPSSQPFGYARARLVDITPHIGRTESAAADNNAIVATLQGTPYTLPEVAYRMFLGNGGDRSVQVSTCLVVALGAPNTTVRCPVPPGLGRARDVVVELSLPGIAGSAVVATGAQSFTYIDPAVDYVTFESTADAPWAGIAATVFTDPVGARVALLHGSNFGPTVGVGSIQRLLRVNYTAAGASVQYDAAAWDGVAIAAASPVHTVWYSWSQRVIAVVTKLPRALAAVLIRGTNSDGSQPVESSSLPVDLSMDQPQVSGLVSAPVGGYTAADTLLTFEIPWRGLQTVATLGVAVVSRVPRSGGGEQRVAFNCTIANLNWDRTAPADAAVPGGTLTDAQAGAAARPACQSYYINAGEVLTDVSPCRTHCYLPPGQGDDAQVQLVVNGAVSLSTQTLVYAQPVLTTVTVTERGGATRVYDLIARPRDVVVLPTAGCTVRIEGRNLGFAPNLLVADPDTPNVAWSNLTAGLLAAATPASTSVAFDAPAGQGATASDGRAFTLRLQTSATQYSRQPFGLPIIMRYAEPAVAAITAPLGLPTTGNVTVWLSGANFGQDNYMSAGVAGGVQVVFTRNDGGPNAVCGSVVRWNHTAISCTLPPGAGAGLTAIVSVAGQSSPAAGGVALSYDPPVIVGVDAWAGDVAGVPTWTPVADAWRIPAPTRGGTVLRLRGRNFGPRMPRLSCAFVAPYVLWTPCGAGALSPSPHCQCTAFPAQCDASATTAMYRAGGVGPYRCNGVEDFGGEGELYDDGAGAGSIANDTRRTDPRFASGAVLSWSHEVIVLTVPTGVGAAVVALETRGATTTVTSEPVVVYAAPAISCVTRLQGHLRTDGGSVIAIEGTNLGFGFPAQRVDAVLLDGNGNGTRVVSRSLDDMYALAATQRPLPIASEDVVPVLGMAVWWWQYCMATGRVFAPSRPARGYAQYTWLDATRCRSRDPDAFAILSHSHERVVLVAHPGVGLNRSLSLSTFGEFSAISASNAVRFDYDAPTIASIQPVRVVLVGGEAEATLRVAGVNYGDLADVSAWDPSDVEVGLWVDGKAALSTLRRLPSADDRLRGHGVVEGRIGGANTLVAGPHSLRVRVAGQVGELLHNSTSPLPLLVGCRSGYFGNVSQLCAPCPLGALCGGYDIIAEVHTYPVPLPTFFNLNGTMSAACPADVAAQYPGRGVCIVGCQPPEACLGGNACAEGYTSAAPMYRCGTCDSGFYRRSAECVKCPDSPVMVVLGFIFIALAACGVAYLLNRKNVNIAFISIGVDYFQVVSLFASSRISWPPQIKELFFLMSAFNLNIEIVAPECMVPNLAYSQKWYAILALPLAVLACFLVAFIGKYVVLRYVRGQRGRERLTKSRHALISGFLGLFYFAYLYISRTLLEPFNCVPATPDDGQRYMAATLEPCDVPGGMQQRLIVPAIVGLVVYTVGYPVYVARTLWVHRYDVMEDQLLRAKGVGDDLLTNPHAYYIRKRIGRLYYAFKPQYYFWCLVIILRKFFIAFAALMFRLDGAFQLAMVLLFVFAAYSLQTRFQPFMSPSERGDVLERHEALRLTSPVHAMLATRLRDIANAGRKRVRSKVDWAAPRLAIARQLARGFSVYLFNYNTLESILLCSALLVCLSGIMFETLSRGTVTASSGSTFTTVATNTPGCSARYVGYCNGLVWAVLLLIVVTIIYFAVVVVAEVVATLNERKAAETAAAASLSRSNSDRPGSMSKRMKAGSGRDMSHGASTAGGPTEQSFNPMFVDGAGKADADDPTAPMRNALALLDDDTPPNKATWAVVQRWCKGVIGQSQDQLAALAELKRKVGELELRLAMGGGAATAPSPRPGGAAGGGAVAGGAASASGGQVSTALKQLKTSRKRVYNPIALPSASSTAPTGSGLGGGFAVGSAGPRLGAMRGSRGGAGRGGRSDDDAAVQDGDDVELRVGDGEEGETLYT